MVIRQVAIEFHLIDTKSPKAAVNLSEGPLVLDIAFH